MYLTGVEQNTTENNWQRFYPYSYFCISLEAKSPFGTFQPSSAFQQSYLNETLNLALYAAIFPLSSRVTSNSATSAILRFQIDSDAVSIAFLAASSQLVGDDPTSSITG